MLRPTRWLAALTAATLATATPAAPVTPGSTESPLAVVPAKAPIVVHVRGLERVRGRLTAMLKEAVPDVADEFVKSIDAGFGNTPVGAALANRNLSGLDKNGSVFVALLELPTPEVETPPVAVIAKVSKYAEFRDGLLTADEKKTLQTDPAGFEKAEVMGGNLYLLDRGGYAAVTMSKDVAALLAKKGDGLDTRLKPELAKKVVENDVAVFVNVGAVAKTYADQIKQGRDFAGMMIEQAAAQAGNLPEGTKKVVESTFQVLEDGKDFVLAFDFRPDGLDAQLHLTVGADTATSKAMKDSRPGKTDEIGTLPAGFIGYMATRPAPGSVSPGMSAGKDNKVLEAAVKELNEAGNSLGLTGADFPSPSLSVAVFKDAQKALAANLKVFEAMTGDGAMQMAPVKGKPEIKPDAETYKGIKFTSVRLVWDFEKMAASGGDALKDELKKMLGEDQKAWLGVQGDKLITVTAKDFAAAKAILDKFLAGTATLGSDPAYAATRKQLPEAATSLIVLDAGRFAQTAGDYMLKMIKTSPAGGLLPNVPDGIKPIAGKPAYIGMVLALRPEYATFDLFLPVTGVKEIKRVIDAATAGQ